MTFLPAFNEIILNAPGENRWLYFQHPEKIIVAHELKDVIPALREVECEVEQHGKYAAGFLSYEAAPAFDPALSVRSLQPKDFPLAWFGIYAQVATLAGEVIQAPLDFQQYAWQANITESDYRRVIRRIKGYIAGGDTYQANFTYRLQTSFTGSGWKLFAALVRVHPAPYAAFLETEKWAICSLSPELFFTLHGKEMASRPMKGTAPRGLTPPDDQRMAKWLYHSKKNRAENVMIVDMVRNDIGRIAEIGSVNVPELFQVEKYASLWQMTSTVRGETSASLSEIFKALFPAASITGAPKIRTMQIISELESSPRRIYTGAIGYYAPGREACFNVAIRTLLLDKINCTAEYGVGGGIVWDSKANLEWEETKTKALLLTEFPQPFDLLETLLWSPEEGWFLLEKHLQRLEQSAGYFSYPLEAFAIRQRLIQMAEGFQDTAQRVRLTIAKNGEISLEHQVLPAKPGAYRLGIAKSPVRSGDRFLYHKTTRRDIYQKAIHEIPGCEDVLLWNERGELTESCIANLVVEQNGELYTPPLKCGLLPGVYRAWLLEKKKVKERIILMKELSQFKRIFLVNSVRGSWEVEL